MGSGWPGTPSEQSFALLLQLLFVFPNIMRWVPGPHQRIYANYLKLAKFVGKRLEMNRQTLDPNSPRDFIDCFLIKIQQVSTSGPALWPLPGPADGGRGFLPDSHSQDSLEEATTVAASPSGVSHPGPCSRAGSAWASETAALLRKSQAEPSLPGPCSKRASGWGRLRFLKPPSKISRPQFLNGRGASLQPCLKNQTGSSALQEKNNPNSHFNEDTMSKSTVNLFFAGTETVSSTLRYGLRILLRHSEVEGKPGEGTGEWGGACSV